MIIFLYGKDTYRLQQKLKEIEGQYKKVHKGGLNLEKINAEQIDFREFWDKLFQRSMFIQKKLFFLDNLFSSQKFKQDFLKKIKKIADAQDIVIVFEKKELAKSDTLFRGLKKHAKPQEFKPLKGKELKDWVVKGFQKYGAEIEEAALEKIIDFVGNDLWRLSNEIKKLSFLKRPAIVSDLREKTTTLPSLIKEEDIELLVNPKIEAGIFETIDSLAQRNKKKALQLLQNHLDKGDSPFYLLKMINFQFRNLLIAGSLREKGKTLNDLLRLNICHPYVAKKSWQASAGFSLSQLKKIYQRIFEADLDIKTGKIKPEEGLRMLIAQI